MWFALTSPRPTAGALTAADEGAISLTRGDDLALIDRLEFDTWPESAVLVRQDQGPPRYCAGPVSASDTDCAPLLARPLGDHVHSLTTAGDFAALAAGRRDLGTESVEFIVDIAQGDVVTFLNSANWDLHYTYVREALRGEPRLDRCDPAQHEEYNRGWYAFSQQEYFKVEGRHYLLGTLVRHAGTDLATVEFTPGDVISAEQMTHAFFTVLQHVPDAAKYFIRPQAPDQIDRLRTIEGTVPVVGPNAPFRGVTFQPLTPGVAFGTLRFVPASELRSVALGPRDIVMTDQVPNDIPLLGGLITESFQTPLAHVNVLSRGRGSPNMALAGARQIPASRRTWESWSNSR